MVLSLLLKCLVFALGWDRRTISDIERGISHKGDGMSDIIKNAKELIAACEGQLALSGDINVTAYVFRGKNYFDMVDKKEVVVTPTTNMGEQMNVEDIVNNIPGIDEGSVVKSE